jgi:hypothetical protein
MGVGKITTFYVKDVINLSSELTVTSDIENHITEYLSAYGLLAAKGKADFALTVYIESINFSALGRTAGGNAATAMLSMRCKLEVADASEKLIFSKVIAYSDSFGGSEEIANYRQDVDTALYSAVENILSEFKYEFDAYGR